MQRGACSSSSRPPSAHHHYCTAGGCSGPSWEKVARNSYAGESCKRHVNEAQAGQRNRPGSKCALGFRRRPSTALNLSETFPCRQDPDLNGVCTPCCAMSPRSVEGLGAASSSSVCPADSEWGAYMKNVVERARYDAYEDCKPCSSSLRQDDDDGGCPCACCSPPPPPRKAAAAPNSGKISQFPEQQLENECMPPPRVPEVENPSPSVSGRTSPRGGSCPPTCNIPVTDDCLGQTGRPLRKKNPLYKRDHPQYHLFREDAHDVPPASPCYSDASGLLCPPPGQVMFPNTVKSNPLQPSEKWRGVRRFISGAHIDHIRNSKWTGPVCQQNPSNRQIRVLHEGKEHHSAIQRNPIMGCLGPHDLWEPHTKKLSFNSQSLYKDTLSNCQQGCCPGQGVTGLFAAFLLCGINMYGNNNDNDMTTEIPSRD